MFGTCRRFIGGTVWFVALGFGIRVHADITYDFSTNVGVDRNAYRFSIPAATIPPTVNTIPSTEYLSSHYAAVAVSDDDIHTTSLVGGTDRAAVRYSFVIGENPSTLKKLGVFWEGQVAGTSGGTVAVYLWNAVTSSYTLVGSTTSDVDVILSLEDATDPAQYVDGSNRVTFLVVNTGDGSGISTDYVKLTVRQCTVNSDCDDNNVCTDDVCSADGACTHPGNTAACSDDNPCTTGDICSAGSCQSGSEPDCSAFGDQCNTVSCDPAGAPGNCEIRTPATDGTLCDDDRFCTVDDECTEGSCGGNPRDCSALTNQCNVGVCDETANDCFAEPVANDTACNDELFCTVDDVCTGGVCGGTARDCSGLGDQCNTGVCNDETNECEAQPVANDTGCDDELFCTVDDVCTGGVCGGTARDCSGSGDQCNTGVCNDETNECEAQPVADDTGCDDELFCTVDDVCTGGVCGGSARDCSGLGDQCNTGVCNDETNECEAQPVANDTGCDDELFCTVDDVCTGGVCGGTARDCSAFGDQCHIGTCNETKGHCESQLVGDGTACDDGLFCTVEDICTGGVCGGSPRDCGAFGDQCHFGTCIETKGLCESQLVDDGTACDDGLFCTVEDVCTGGVCGGSPLDCSGSGDQCNAGSCNESGDFCEAQPLANGTSCNDANPCTLGETCQDGLCTGGSAPDCSSAGNQCLTASCGSAGAEGNCNILTPVADGTTCDDGLFCRQGDQCISGVCTSTSDTCPQLCDEQTDACVECLDAGDCDDFVACTDEVCEAGVCRHEPNDAHCLDDGAFCTGTEFCDSQLGCQSTGDPCPVEELCAENTDSCGECLIDADCNDGVDCTDDTCNAGGCVYTANDANCPDDGSFCNGTEICDSLLNCVATGDPCLKGEFCNEKTDVCDQCIEDTDCEDGNPCTVDHACVGGVCIPGEEVDCSASDNQCNTASCDPGGAVGNCDILTPVENGISCDDGLFCTVEDVCTGGVCGGTARDCGGSGDQCNAGACNDESDECEARPVKDGTVCDDELFCTVGDVCTGGVCGGTARDCSGLGDQCNTGVCNDETNECEAQPVADDKSCDDELFCTVDDVCTGGVCGGTARDCSGSGDQCHIGTCNETKGLCESQLVGDGTGCDDGLFCTVKDACTGGVCGGTARDCGGSGDQCNTGVCNDETNECEAQPVADDTACDDELFCTVADVCTGGVCGGSARDCSGSGDQCNTGVCNDETNECEAQPVADDTSCDDELFCTVDDVCTGGVCGGSARDCSGSGDPCNTGVCNDETNECEAQPVADDTVCDDELFCTVDDVCTGGVCGGSARDCSGLGDQCNTGVCNDDTNECEAQPVADDTACDDELFCTVDDVCTGGVCGGTARDCSGLGDQCNTGVCNDETNECEAQPVADDTSCDDELFCTVDDVCTGGVCGGSARDCSGSGDPCNTGVCNDETNECEAQPVADDKSCDDELFCTVDDVCTGGVCGGSARDCSGLGDQCNTGVCNDDTNECEAQPVADDTSCDDELFCTVDDVCTGGVCGGTARDCSGSGDQCNTGVCNDETNECEAQPVKDGTECDDADARTSNDVCSDGTCAGQPSYGLMEWDQLYDCFDGVGVAIDSNCDYFDFDSDGDVDLADAAEFMRRFEMN